MALTNSESLSTDPLTTHRSPTQAHQTLISYLMTFYISHSCTTSSSIPWVTIYPWLHCVLLSSWRVLRKLHVTLYCNWGVAPCLCSQVTMWDNYFSWHILTQTFILNKYLIETAILPLQMVTTWDHLGRCTHVSHVIADSNCNNGTSNGLQYTLCINYTILNLVIAAWLWWLFMTWWLNKCDNHPK